MSSYVLGIDCGTAYTAAVVARPGGVAQVVTLGTSSSIMPTVVVLREDGEVLVGEAAARRALEEPTRTAREFKRRLGDPAPIIVGGTPFGAETLIAYVLAHVHQLVSDREGGPPERVVLTHPASWGPYKTDLLRHAAQLARLGTVELVPEPVAAAIHYAAQERIEPGALVAVYDFGGGTFDAAVLQRTTSGFALVGQPEGIERLGGIDFDAAVLAHVDRVLEHPLGQLNEDDEDHRRAVARLAGDCRAAKETLSADTDTSIAVVLPALTTSVRLTRAEFERMIQQRVSDTVDVLKNAIASAGVELGQIDRVLLVGGSSRIPLVAQQVAAATGRPVAVDTDPKLAIATGAAVFAVLAAAPAPPPAPSDHAAVPFAADPATVDDPPAATTYPTSAAAPPPTDRPPAPLVQIDPGPPPTGPSGRRRTLARVTGGVLLALGLAAGAVIAAGNDNSVEVTAANDQEVLLEPVTTIGENPFTDDTTGAGVDDLPAIDLTTLDLPQAQPGQVITVSAEAPGLYGGSGQINVCDKTLLADFLTTHADKAAAWTQVLGLRNDASTIRAYIASLTPVILRTDTRVTNHGFRDGRAYALNSVLQAGTAVLVDRNGVPRVKCKCGNPLAPARRLATNARVVGTPWAGFDLANTVAIAPAAEPIEVFVLSNVVDGTRLEVPAGSGGPSPSVSSSTSPSTTTTTTTTTTIPPSSVPSATQNVTSLGQVTASSEYSGEFAKGLAVDGDESTSWFSDGVPGGDTEVYEWDAGSEITIDRVTIVGNGANADPSIRSGFGFDAVTIEILDGAGKVVSTRELDLSGTPDPDVSVEPHVLGRHIRLTFRGHESPDCGGFAELVVEGGVPVG